MKARGALRNTNSPCKTVRCFGRRTSWDVASEYCLTFIGPALVLGEALAAVSVPHASEEYQSSGSCDAWKLQTLHREQLLVNATQRG